MLREPFDIDVRAQFAKFCGDHNVALRATKSDRRRDEEGALAAPGPP
jgi:hypothetical protein